MSSFVTDHVTRVFIDAGYALLEIHGDRGGIVQGDGLHLVVAPEIAAAAKRFSNDPAVQSEIVNDAAASSALKLSLYGGSSSVDREGIWLGDDFLGFLKDECTSLYYRAQREVNAIFDAEDAPDREWCGRDQAYVGIVDEFAMDDSDGRRFVRVLRKADQSFNPYGSGDEHADHEDAQAVIEGRASHGTVEIEIHRLGNDATPDAVGLFEFASEEEFDPDHFVRGKAELIVSGAGLIWPRDDQDAHTLELAAELVADDDELSIAAALKQRAIGRGLDVDEATRTAETRPAF